MIKSSLFHCSGLEIACYLTWPQTTYSHAVFFQFINSCTLPNVWCFLLLSLFYLATNLMTPTCHHSGESFFVLISLFFNLKALTADFVWSFLLTYIFLALLSLHSFWKTSQKHSHTHVITHRMQHADMYTSFTPKIIISLWKSWWILE